MYLIFDETESKHFVGRTGRFIPVTPESGGALLMRIKDDKSYAVSGTKGFFWIEADMAKQLGDDLEIDMAYFENLTNEAIKTINKFGDYESFVDSNCE